VKYVFVLGTGRCGSTLVQEVLARHPDAGFVSNLEDRSRLGAMARRWNNQAYRLLPQTATRKGRMRFAPSEAYRALDREVSPVLSRPWRDLTAADITPWLADRTRRFFERRAQMQGTPVFLHKFTGWPRAGFLGCVFPEAKFVHVVRDGRAVANSWLQMGWWEGFNGPDHWQWGPLAAGYQDEWSRSGHSFPVLAGILWKLLLDAFDEAAGSLPAHRWLEVKYEDVVANPSGAFNEMREFAGLKPSGSFSSAVAGMTFDPGRVAAYRKDLGDETVEVLTRSLATHLARRGYAL
jgi:hypothetical protein